MRYFSYIITFFAHPIWFPIYGAMLVLFQIPFSPSIEIVKYTWLLLLLITVALPTLIYLMLFVLNWLNDPFEVPVEKQKWLCYGYIVMLLFTAFKITPIDHYPILYFYIMNLLISTFIILLMHYLKFVGNIFAMGVGALTSFSILLSITFEIDLTYIIALLIFLSGATLSAQAYLSGQTIWKLAISWIIGALPQLSLIILFKNLLFGLT